ncbi:Uncharacterised protein [Mycobacteroides abscessus subsp. abscessus]|nr:Uncharacterised protein [Mycobacteroides abscessus subsp. abscessus]
MLDNPDDATGFGRLHRVLTGQLGQHVQIHRLTEGEQLEHPQHRFGQLLDPILEQRGQLRGDRGTPAQLPHAVDLPQRARFQRAFHQMP